MIAAYLLDADGPQGAPDATGTAPDGLVREAAGAWDAARGLSGAGALILRRPERTLVVAANLILDGRPGLNIGLLLPTLRTLPAAGSHAHPAIAPFTNRFHRALWDIAERLARIEADRVVAFRLGKREVTLHAGRAGIRFLAGCDSLAEFVDLVRSCAGTDDRILYSLTGAPEPGPGETYPVTALFGPTAPTAEVFEFAADGWPELPMRRATMDEMTALVGLAQRLCQIGVGQAFVLADLSGRILLSGTTTATGVRMTPSAEYLADV